MESDLPSLWVRVRMMQRGGASGAARREFPQSWGSLQRTTHPEDPASSRMFPFFFFFFNNIHLCIWLCWVFLAALGILQPAGSQLQPMGSSSLT